MVLHGPQSGSQRQTVSLAARDITFSYGRALQNVALRTWAGRRENFPAARQAFSHRAHMNSLAALGEWSNVIDRAA